MNKRIFPAAALLLILAAAYYWGFLAPIQQETAQATARTAVLEEQVAAAAGELARMNEMEAALSAPSRQYSGAVAPYDNQAAVLQLLNSILAASEEYSLRFSDPVISGDGMVRRSVILQLRCADLEVLTGILQALSDSPWRCQVSSLSISAPESATAISASATVTFFESTRLK